MTIARAASGILLIAAVAVFSALSIATSFTRTAPRERTAPEAWAALEGRDPERAAALFRHELTRHPEDARLHFGAASAAYALGRKKAALSSLRTAVELDPQFVDALIMLGRVAYERGDSSLAIQSMEKASALRPRDRDVREVLDRWRRESSVHSSYLEKPAGHFRILYEGSTRQNIGDRVARVLEREYDRVGKALNSFLPDTVTVILYTDREFHDITRSPSWAIGNYDGRIRIAVGGTFESRDLDRVVTHELVHAVVAAAAPRRVPAWLDEGLAAYLETSDRAATRTWAAAVIGDAATIVPLDKLAKGFNGLDEQEAMVAYAESAIAAEILCRQLGANIGAFLKLVGNGRSIDDGLLEFQVQPNAFHAEWRRRVGLQ